jgi:probable O-glycosylation ligase (exosortase A-associated)
MSLRDIVLTAVLLGAIPFCFGRPWIGLLFWYWIAYMNPHRQTWSFAYDMNFALFVAAATLPGFLFTTQKKAFVWTRETVLLLTFWVWTAVTTAFAWYPEDAFEKWTEFSKVLLMTVLIIPLFQDRRRLRILLYVVAGSLGYYGFKGGLFAIMTGGQWQILGPRGSFIEANTELSLALVMVLPMLAYLTKDETRKWVRRLLWAAFFLTMIAIPFTYSRSGFVGLVVALVIMFLKAKRWAKVALVPIGVLGVVAFLSFAPEQWTSRIETLENVEADESANLRFMSWKAARGVASDSPIFGGGFRVLLQRAVYDRHVPEYPRAFGHDAHSVYFNLLADHGPIGLAIFLALMGSTLLSLRRLEKLGREWSELEWISNWARMLTVSLVAYMVSGITLSVAYFDLTYQLIAIAIVLKQLARDEVARVSGSLLAPAGAVTATVGAP